MPNRTFNEEEVAELLRRAAELQARSASGGAVEPAERAGLSLDELAAIAAEAGLDPEHLRQAADEMTPRRRTPRSEARVSSREITVDRWVDGHLSEDARENIVMELRHRYDTTAWQSMGMPSYGKSVTQALGRSVEWQHVHPWWGTQTRVLIQPRDEGVRIRVSLSNAYSGTATSWSPYYAPMIALALGFISGPIAGSLWIGILVALAALAVLFPLVTAQSRRAEAHQRAEAERLADEIAAHVAPPERAPRRTELHTDARRDARVSLGPTLDLPLDDEESEPLRAPSRQRER